MVLALYLATIHQENTEVDTNGLLHMYTYHLQDRAQIKIDKEVFAISKAKNFTITCKISPPRLQFITSL